MGQNERIAHGAPPDQMLLDDPLERRRIALAIPRPLWIDDGNRSTLADAQAVGLRAEDPAAFGQPKLFEPLLEIGPRSEPAFLVTAFRGRLVAAQEDVSLRRIDTNRHRDAPLSSSRPLVRCGQRHVAASERRRTARAATTSLGT